MWRYGLVMMGFERLVSEGGKIMPSLLQVSGKERSSMYKKF